MTKSQLKNIIKDIIIENYQNDINEISKKDIMAYGLAAALGISSGLGIHLHNKNKSLNTNNIIKTAFTNPNLRSNYSAVKNISIDLNTFFNSLYKNHNSASSSYNNFLNNTTSYKNNLNTTIANIINNSSFSSYSQLPYLSNLLNTIDPSIKDNILITSTNTAITISSNFINNNPSLNLNQNAINSLKYSIQDIIILKIIDDAFKNSIKDLKYQSHKKPFYSA